MFFDLLVLLHICRYVCTVYVYTKQNQPWTVKKGTAKQSRNQEYCVAHEMNDKNKG